VLPLLYYWRQARLAEYEIEKIRTGGLFSGVKVGYMFKYERAAEGGEVHSISMFHYDDGRLLARLEYTKFPEAAKVNSFVVNDWSTPKFGESLLRKFIRLMNNQLQLYRNFGFNIESAGNITGYTQYTLRRIL
jgi:hypothetical protein